ncbi:hypothetical protein QZM35_03920 [Burkholderia sp. AU45274]|uniref:hypothetical protein n=1 Tax=Burkholderia sp. AU45274 TaxID=3059205 RepID=UPI00264E2853|nr:hypothetical protein [Burkholderia sp. AU45274]MDN7486835.1 hypothetical protein [Burkholderia sp. AU45274]
MEGAACSAPPDGIGGRTARHSFGLATPACCHAARAAAIEKFAHGAVSVRFLYDDAVFADSRGAGSARACRSGGFGTTGRASRHVTVAASIKMTGENAG